MQVSNASFSGHARLRAQKRGVCTTTVDHILRHADRRKWVGSGCQSYSISRRRLAALGRDEMPPQLRDRADGVAIVVDEAEGIIITVLHMDGRRGRRYRGSMRD